jgi:hypothetical protein
MSCPIDVLIGATRPIFIFRASADGAGFEDNSTAAMAEMMIITTTIIARIFLCNFKHPFVFLCYIKGTVNKINSLTHFLCLDEML